MTLSIVVVNWNTEDRIRECLDSIFEFDSQRIESGDYEIIVIDNGSADGSLVYLKSLGNKIVLISNSTNAGYAHASNQGMRIANGEFVLLLGSDTKMKTGTLETCIEFMKAHNDAGAVGCKLLNTDGSVQNNCKIFPTLKNAFYTYLSLDRLNKDYDMASFKYDLTIEVDQIATSFLMVRKAVLDRINYFDEKFRILYNDVDLCRKIHKENYKIYFVHSASIIHFGSYSTKKAGYKVRKIMYEDIYRYYKDNFGFNAVFLYPILVLRLLLVSLIKS